MPDSQEIPLVSEPYLRYSRTSPHPRKHASDIQECPSSRKRTGDTHELPLIQGNLSKIFKNFPACVEWEVSLPPSQKLSICPFPKADETGPPIPNPFIYILISFYVFQVTAFLHAFSRNPSKDFFLIYKRHMRCPFILLDLLTRVMFGHE
jgi:hypothetical protein